MKDIIKTEKETCPHCKKEYLFIIKYSMTNEGRRTIGIGCPHCCKVVYDYTLGKHEDWETKTI